MSKPEAMTTRTRKAGMDRYDVLAINIKTSVVRLLDTGKSEENADAVKMMAIARRGVETEFYSVVPTGRYRDGDKWEGQ